MLAALFAVGLLVTSCGGGTSEADQVKDFALDFATMLMVKGGLEVVKPCDGPAMMAVGTLGANVVSTCDKAISGSDYEVVFKGMSVGYWGEQPLTTSEPGKDIAPNGSAMVTTDFSVHADYNSAYVNIKISNDELFNKYFTPTGKEYDEYLAGKTEEKK